MDGGVYAISLTLLHKKQLAFMEFSRINFIDSQGFLPELKFFCKKFTQNPLTEMRFLLSITCHQ
jgi:hypothetical protein